jgi:hypothetical protein
MIKGRLFYDNLTIIDTTRICRTSLQHTCAFVGKQVQIKTTLAQWTWTCTFIINAISTYLYIKDLVNLLSGHGSFQFPLFKDPSCLRFFLFSKAFFILVYFYTIQTVTPYRNHLFHLLLLVISAVIKN